MTAPERLLAGRPWMADALCTQVDHDLWFPEKGQPTRQAKRICAACPVRETCLTYAVENQEAWGVWGGLSEPERRKVADQRGLPRPSRARDLEPACGTYRGYRRHRAAGEEACEPCKAATRRDYHERKVARAAA